MSKVLNVLVAADERVAARAVAAHANRVEGFHTAATVGSAAACLRRLAGGGIDLVLLDLHQERPAAAELVDRIAALGLPVEVIIVTAAGDAVQPPAEVRQLAKPFTFPAFRETLLGWAADRPVDGSGVGDAPFVPPQRAGHRRRTATGALPRGLRVDTLDAIADVLRDRYEPASVELPGTDTEGLSATSVASAIGASRFTARRYLEYLADAGVVARSLRHRSLGRPEAIYRPAPQTT